VNVSVTECVYIRICHIYMHIYPHTHLSTRMHAIIYTLSTTHSHKHTKKDSLEEGENSHTTPMHKFVSYIKEACIGMEKYHLWGCFG